MLEWLSSYGVKRFECKKCDLDVNDRLALQDQINRVRSELHQLLELMDEVQGKYVEIAAQIAVETKRITEQAALSGQRANTLFATDQNYLELEAKQKALSAGLSMINQQVDFYKNDLRILNSVFYNKF